MPDISDAAYKMESKFSTTIIYIFGMLVELEKKRLDMLQTDLKQNFEDGISLGLAISSILWIFILWLIFY